MLCRRLLLMIAFVNTRTNRTGKKRYLFTCLCIDMKASYVLSGTADYYQTSGLGRFESCLRPVRAEPACAPRASAVSSGFLSQSKDAL